VLVKEVREVGDAGAPGGLRYTAVMRKLWDQREGSPAPETPIPLEGGWIFTQIKGGDERWLESCWQSCHAQATWDGAWLDYGE
jgi:hypothetical protein